MERSNEWGKRMGDIHIMKTTGILRNVDELGRFVLPSELRQTLNINIKDSLEFFIKGNEIVLQKYEPTCIFCGNANDIIFYKNKKVCLECSDQLILQN